jgi:alanine racemase
MSRHAVAILSTENLHHNISVIKSHTKAKIIAMVKANGYGHGIRSVSQRLDSFADLLGVASIDEALALRKVGVKLPILLSEGVFEASELLQACTENFHVVFHNNVQIEWLKKASLPRPISVWLKVDTGLGRLGFEADEAAKHYKTLLALKCVEKPIRVMSHFACSDKKDHPLNQIQIDRFTDFKENYTNTKLSEYSFCNSGAIFHFPNQHHDYVRPGLSIYGVNPLFNETAADLGLRPVMTLQTNLIAVNQMPKGATIGYGARYTCPEDMPIGIIAFGYGDGYPISAKDGTPVLVNQVKCPIVGRVSMDMMAVDLRPIVKNSVSQSNVTIGDPVILWGDGLPLEEVASYTTSSVYDILTGVQNRVRFLWTRN